MSRIEILPPELINQIAAGEVVERPASIIKELVENALDAGATRIEIIASNGGQDLRVADNGCGMDRDDLTVAFKNHATSKVKSLDDLFNIGTLGFRGEALASIAAIAKVTCSSRPGQSENGLKAVVDPSGEVTLSETGCAPGTIFEVKDLFYNVPARLKFLKRPQTELSHSQEMVQVLAMSHPDVAFQLKLENSVAVKTSGSGILAKTLHEIFTLSESESLLSFDMQDSEFSFRAWGQTSTPNVTRGSKKWLMTFVNGRVVRCPILTKAIESAYQGAITPGRFPVSVLFLEIPAEEVDVNVHPTKKEVKYQRANTIFSFVRRAIEQALESANVSAIQAASFTPSQNTAASPSRFASPGETPSKTGTYHQKTSGHEIKSSAYSSFKRPDTRPSSVLNQAALDLYEPTTGSSESYLPQVPDYKIIGQLAETYILVETAEGLLIVDQHIASERVRFEQLSEQAEKTEPVSQTLLLPLVRPTSPEFSAVLQENHTVFETLGFRYESSEHSVSFHAIPGFYNERYFKASLESLLKHLEETGEVQLSTEDVIATAACHSAVRAGDTLNMEQMQQVIQQWMGCKRPWTCPHGRPVAHTLTHNNIMHFFDRPSLPVTKSV